MATIFWYAPPFKIPTFVNFVDSFITIFAVSVFLDSLVVIQIVPITVGVDVNAIG